MAQDSPRRLTIVVLPNPTFSYYMGFGAVDLNCNDTVEKIILGIPMEFAPNQLSSPPQRLKNSMRTKFENKLKLNQNNKCLCKVDDFNVIPIHEFAIDHEEEFEKTIATIRKLSRVVSTMTLNVISPE